MAKLVSLLLSCSLFTSCILTDVQMPLDTDLQETSLGAKKGTSSYQSILGLIAWGDAGTQAAAKEGEISVLRHADQQVFAVLGFLYYKQTTVVYGD